MTNKRELYISFNKPIWFGMVILTSRKEYYQVKVRRVSKHKFSKSVINARTTKILMKLSRINFRLRVKSRCYRWVYKDGKM